MNKTQVQRDNRLKASNAAKGLKQVTVWVPVSRCDELKALAAKWREA